MKIDQRFLRSKVARRIFSLFVFCALVPITALAIISFTQVTEQLNQQGLRRLHQSKRTLGMSILERLSFVDNELKLFSQALNASSGVSAPRPSEKYYEYIKKRFRALALATHSGRLIPFFGHIQDPPEQSAEEKKHLRSGKTLVLTLPNRDNRLHIYMMRAVDPQDLKQGILFGEIDSLYLWGLMEDNTLTAATELCVLDPSNRVIFSTQPLPSSFLKKLAVKMKRSSLGRFEWKNDNKKYLASFWAISLKFNFFYPKWTIVLSVPKDYILAPMYFFKKIFPLVILFSLLLVLLLSAIQIRRTTHPIEKLKEGTRRIANRDFGGKVTVQSDDEFEDLATSFNDMARQLGRQFSALTTMAEIDRAILSSLDTEKIVDTVMNHMRKVFNYDFVSVILFHSKGKNPPRTFTGSDHPEVVKRPDGYELTPEEAETFIDHQEILSINVEEDLPHFLVPFAMGGMKSFIVLPLILKQKLTGIIILGSLDSSEPIQEDLLQARQLADQVAVALSNAQLLEELDFLNWGALTALARAVDAKSPWTAGHSERVTEIALKIGRVLGLAPEELENLHRGGLLHDIGKIGIPADILDKPGRLLDEEHSSIQGHPGMGARILEPIAAYAHIIPIVLQHHERFDGKGYPNGLAGEDLSLGARILAVADVYDALVSNRPYRAGIQGEDVIEIIRQESGKQFDPNVVQAFLEVMTKQERAGKEDEIKTATLTPY